MGMWGHVGTHGDGDMTHCRDMGTCGDVWGRGCGTMGMRGHVGTHGDRVVAYRDMGTIGDRVVAPQGDTQEGDKGGTG